MSSSGGHHTERRQPGALAQTLSGFRIGVTSDRRSDELISAFKRRGADVIHAPALRIAPLTESSSLREETQSVIDAEPDYAIICTAYGMRRWIEAADADGLGPQLRTVLDAASILVRGAKARGAVRAAGFDDDGSAEDERTSTVLDMLLRHDLTGRTVVLQLHGMPSDQDVSRIQDAGARVITVMPYTWTAPDEDSELLGLIDAAIDQRLDLVTFTSAPAVEAFLAVAHHYGKLQELLQALTTDVTAVAVGPVTAAPLIAAGVQPLVPQRWRLGAMIRTVCEHLEVHGVHRTDTRHGPLEIRGDKVRLGRGETAHEVRLTAGPLSLLRALVEAGPAVCSRQELLATLHHCDSGHVLETWVWRLRKAFDGTPIVETVVKRGYRLAR